MKAKLVDNFFNKKSYNKVNEEWSNQHSWNKVYHYIRDEFNKGNISTEEDLIAYVHNLQNTTAIDQISNDDIEDAAWAGWEERYL